MKELLMKNTIPERPELVLRIIATGKRSVAFILDISPEGMFALYYAYNFFSPFNSDLSVTGIILIA